MKRRQLIIVLIISLFSLLLSNVNTVSAQITNVPQAGVFVNGKVVDGINPIKIGNSYYLPLTHLSKILGYNDIQFEERTLTYQMTDGSTTIRTTMGGTKARRGAEYINIEPPRWINKTAYVSLNTAGALFNANVTFKRENGSIQVKKPAQYYIVQHGDSLWLIAQAHHTTVQSLKEVNGLTSNLIVVGQKLKLPPHDKAKEMDPIRKVQPDPYKGTDVGTKRKNVIDQAVKYLGAGYKFGAALADAPKLFDCSSFTQLVFKQNGINIPRVSRDQAAVGRVVNDLQPGDLMFFTNVDLYSDGRVGHVGIYMGDGSMIHASTSQGVTITDNVLGNPYWGANYLYSKRFIE